MADNNSANYTGGKFMSGFLWGALIGGGIVFLLGTKKGKKIIKTLSEEGIELSQLLGDDEEEEEIEEIIVRPKNKAHKQESVKAAEETGQEEESMPQESNGVKKASAISKIVSTPRRFFKGTPKR